jgi:hypothetical protein
MATQGVVSIVRGEKILYKIVAGSNGMKALEFALDVLERAVKLSEDPQIKFEEKYTMDGLYQIASYHNFGGSEDLVVQGGPQSMIFNDGDLDDTLWFQHWENHTFNPRWECGIASYIYVVDVDWLDVINGNRTKLVGGYSRSE